MNVYMVNPIECLNHLFLKMILNMDQFVEYLRINLLNRNFTKKKRKMQIIPSHICTGVESIICQSCSLFDKSLRRIQHSFHTCEELKYII